MLDRPMRVTIWVPRKLWRSVKVRAVHRDTTPAAIVRGLLAEYVAPKKVTKP